MAGSMAAAWRWRGRGMTAALVLFVIFVSGGGCTPEPFSPPLGTDERVLLDQRGEDTVEDLPMNIETAGGEVVGTLEAGQARKGWTLFFRAPGSGESLLWGVDTVGELYVVSQTRDGRFVRLYWYTPGLFGPNAMVTQLRTGSGETVSRRAPERSWVDAVSALRASGSPR